MSRRIYVNDDGEVLIAVGDSNDAVYIDSEVIERVRTKYGVYQLDAAIAQYGFRLIDNLSAT